MAYLNNLNDISNTQVLATGLILNDVIKKEFLEELKSKLGKEYEDMVTADIRVMLITKAEENIPLKEDKKGVIIQVRDADFIRFEQPSPEHYKNKVVVITSNRKGKIDKVLKNE